MKKEKINLLLDSMLCEEIPPESIHLWPAIQKNLVMRKQPTIKQGDMKMNNNIKMGKHARWLTLTAVLTFLLAVIMIATPQGRAFAQSVLRFFTRSGSNVMQLPELDASLETQDNQTMQPEAYVDAGASVCGSPLLPTCNLSEAQKSLDFEILLPGELPQGLQFTGAALVKNGVVVKYEGSQGIILLAQTQPEPQEISIWTIARDATVEPATINNQPAEFIQGGWAGLGINEEGSMVWDSQLPTRTLRWKNGDTQLTLVNFPASSAQGAQGMNLAQMTALAERIAPTDDTLEGYDLSNGITLAEAEEQAGFDFIQPAWLPDNFNLEKTTHDSQHNSICQHYQYGTGSAAPALVIAQSNWALPPISDLQARASYDGQEVEIPHPQTHITLPGALGDTGKLLENGVQTDAFCGGNPLIANRALVWRIEGRSLILFAQLDAYDGRGFTTIKEMQRVAEALNGLDSGGQNTGAPDTERLLSKAEAEQASGVEIQLPTKLLSNVRFDYISFRPRVEDLGPIITTQYLADPVGDGRFYLMNIFQMPNSQNTLENIKLAGGFSPAAVRGKDALYQAQCWDSTALAGGIECHQILTWFDNDTQFEIFSHFPAELPKEIMISIAESMQ